MFVYNVRAVRRDKFVQLRQINLNLHQSVAGKLARLNCTLPIASLCIDSHYKE